MAVAVQQQDQIKVYVNADGAIVILQALPYGEDIDCVAVQPCHAEALIRAIRAAKRKALEAKETT